MKSFALALAAVSTAFFPAIANASVAQVTANGFAIRQVAQVSSSPEETWAVLVKPSVWWNSEHTWSGDAANLSLDARAGGCFCEIMPNETAPKATPRGTVEHMRVIFIDRARALRMVGALGPLQAEAITATLTVQLKGDAKGGTQILLQYVVGGFSRTPFEKLAPAVDGMLDDQVKRLASKLGGSFAAAFPMPEPEATEQPVSPPAEVEENAPKVDVLPLSDAPLPANDPLAGR